MPRTIVGVAFAYLASCFNLGNGDCAYRDRRGLWLTSSEGDGALDLDLLALDDDLPGARLDGRVRDTAIRLVLATVTRLAKVNIGSSYQVEVTCWPWGCVLRAEQAYWLPLGPTRTGLMDSGLHP